jgi:hypothetical protein
MTITMDEQRMSARRKKERAGFWHHFLGRKDIFSLDLKKHLLGIGIND